MTSYLIPSAKSAADNAIFGLLAEAVLAKDAAKEQKKKAAAQARLERARERSTLSAADRAERAAEARILEDLNRWRDVRCWAIFEKYKCMGCGHSHTIFRQFMLEQVGTKTDSKHLITIPKPKEGLELAVGVEKWNAPMCTKCAMDFGVELSTAQNWSYT